MKDIKLGVVVPVFNEPRVTDTLEGIYRQNNRINGTEHIVVDNGSTDNTRSIIERFMHDHDDFPVRIIDEPTKGTGSACNTGFKEAERLGCTVVARTDGDTVPNPYWTQRISNCFELNPCIKLLGGKSIAHRDEYYRKGDDILMPLAIRSARIAMAIKNLDLDYLHVVVGHNMATTTQTYLEVGGFDKTSIDEADEDIEYSLKVISNFGKESVHIDPDMVVATSMRRIRKYGIIKTSIHHLFPGKRDASKLVVDIR